MTYCGIQKRQKRYLKVMAVLQKYVDSKVFSKYTYNLEHYEDEKVPMSVLIQDQ